MARRKRWTEEQHSMFRTLYSVIPVKELAEKMKSSVQSLRSMACQLGITQPRKYTVNEHYFDCIDTTEKAYWLGFLFADGSIGKRYKVGTPVNVRLEIDKRDAEHVTEFIKALGSDVPLSYRPNRNTVTAIICDPQLAGRTAQLIRPKETATPWLGLSEDLQIAFIRGVFDGDGCVTHCGATPRIEFLGNAAFCSLVESLAPIKFSRREYHSKNGWLFNLYATGVSKLRDFAFWLYGVDGPCLQRKLWRFGSFGIIPFIAGGALPNQINKDVPAGSDLPSTIDNRIRNLALAVEDILGIPDQTNISAAGFGWDSSGLSSIRFQNAAVYPSVSGHLQRVADNLVYHDGTSSYGLVLDTKTGTLANKTQNNPTLTGTVSGSATYTGATLTGLQGPITGVVEFASTHTLALNPPWRVSATVAGNALTVAIKNIDGNDATATSTIPFAFNTNTLTDSRIVIGTMSTAVSVVAPSTATLGFTASQTSRIWVGAYYDAGAAKPFLWHTYDSASSNYSIKLPGPNTVSTTAISAGSDSAGVAYATAAISNAPWQWLGYIEIQSDATPGNWANSPTVQRSVPAWGPRPGMTIQDIYQDDGLFSSGTGTIPNDNSIPQQTEGNQFMKQSITYTSAVNLAEIEHVGVYGESTNVNFVVALFQGSGLNALGVWYGPLLGGADTADTVFTRFRHVPGTAASSFEYKIRTGLESAGTTYFNSDTSSPKFAGLSKSSIRIREIMV